MIREFIPGMNYSFILLFFLKHVTFSDIPMEVELQQKRADFINERIIDQIQPTQVQLLVQLTSTGKVIYYISKN